MYDVIGNNSITDCLFLNNTSKSAGGAIYLFIPGDLTIARCVFKKNNALQGSALYYEESALKTLMLISCDFNENVAWDNGAALFIREALVITIENCRFNNNAIEKKEKDDLGSILFLNNPGNLTISFSNFEGNEGIIGTCIYYSETSKKIFLIYST